MSANIKYFYIDQIGDTECKFKCMSEGRYSELFPDMDNKYWLPTWAATSKSVGLCNVVNVSLDKMRANKMIVHILGFM